VSASVPLILIEFYLNLKMDSSGYEADFLHFGKRLFRKTITLKHRSEYKQLSIVMFEKMSSDIFEMSLR